MKYKVKDVDAESQHSRKCDEKGVLEEKLERTVTRSALLVAALAVSLVALSVYTAVLLLSERAPETCVSEQCVQTASRVLAALERGAAPCADFYEFACGGWVRRHPVPDSATSWDQLAVLREQLVEDLRELLEESNSTEVFNSTTASNVTEVVPASVRKAQALYRTCVDEDQLEATGLAPVRATLAALGLPAAPPRAPAARFAWERVAGAARRTLGLSVLLGVQVAEDVRNTSRHRIVMEQVTPGFSERYLLQPEQFAHELAHYRSYIVNMVTAAVANTTDVVDAEAFANEIVNFSRSLAEIMTPVEVRRGGTHMFHEVSVLQLIQGASGGPSQWKKHDWRGYLERVFADTNVTLREAEDRVVVMDLPYLQRLAVLLANAEPLAVERFMWWSVFSTVAPMTLRRFRELGFEFSRAVYGLRERAPRWKSCAANVNANFGLALSYLYVKRHFDADSRQKAITMLEDVRSAFGAAVQSLEWMDGRTRARTLEKLRAIRSFVGFPAWLSLFLVAPCKLDAITMLEDVRSAFGAAVQSLEWMDGSTRARTLEKLRAIRSFVGFPAWLLTPERLDKHYRHAEVVEGNLFETYKKLTQAAVKKSLEILRETPDRNRWVATATTVNAFYSATLNSVTFPAGILQPPFYGNGIEAINYGSIGAIMGHEVTHGFDDQGRRYDENGNLKQWWSAATLEHYHERVSCIVDQYNQYHMAQLPNYTVHGFNTQGENIADNGGLRAALSAYRLHAAREPRARRQRLPGLPAYTPEQLFFLGFAQIWCGNSTVGALKSKLVEGVHSPNKIRVIGTLSNSKEFAEAWQCAKGTPMNPEHKCVLW